MYPPVQATTAEQASRLSCSGPDAFPCVPPEIKSLHSQESHMIIKQGVSFLTAFQSGSCVCMFCQTFPDVGSRRNVQGKRSALHTSEEQLSR